MRGEILQLSQDGGATLGGLRREIGQRLHGEGFHDAARVAQRTSFCSQRASVPASMAL